MLWVNVRKMQILGKQKKEKTELGKNPLEKMKNYAGC